LIVEGMKETSNFLSSRQNTKVQSTDDTLCREQSGMRAQRRGSGRPNCEAPITCCICDQCPARENVLDACTPHIQASSARGRLSIYTPPFHILSCMIRQQQYKLRGEICIGVATLFSFAAVMLLIFVHVGQINTSSVPRGIAMAKINVSQYGQALEKGLGDPITGLYAANASAPLQKEAGLRQEYKFGVYGYCGYVNDSAGVCSNTSLGRQYQPYNALLADMSLNYSALTIFIINGTSSFESQSIGSHTRSASYLIVLGTVCAFLAFVIGVFKHTLAFLASACLAMLSTVFILIAASLWTSAIKTSESVNGLILNTTDIPLGIKVSSGSGLSLLWGAVGCLFASLVPYLISCCTFRG